jgi:hypothetical protein
MESCLMSNETPTCDDCGMLPAITDGLCTECYDRAAEAAWERQQEDGETFRGGEAAAYEAEQQARIQRELK